jgi:hypothetical protein
MAKGKKVARLLSEMERLRLMIAAMECDRQDMDYIKDKLILDDEPLDDVMRLAAIRVMSRVSAAVVAIQRL